MTRIDDLGIDDFFTLDADPSSGVWEVRSLREARVFCVGVDDYGQRVNDRGFLELPRDEIVTRYEPLNPRKKADRHLAWVRRCLRDGLCITDVWLATLDDRDNVLPEDYVPRTGLLILERKARAWAACDAVVGEWTEEELAASIVYVKYNLNSHTGARQLQLRLRMYSRECVKGRPKEFALLYDLRDARHIHDVPQVASAQVAFGYTHEEAIALLTDAYHRLNIG